MKFRWAIALTLLLSASVQADNFRCGKWIATTSLTVSDLLAKCGEPASRETRVEDIMSRNQSTGVMFKSGEMTVEVWTFDRGATASPMVVTIVDGRIKSIERKQ